VLVALRSLLERFGIEFFLVITKPNPYAEEAAANPDKAYEVITRSSENLNDLAAGQDLKWRVPSVIRSGKQHAQQEKQLRLPFCEAWRSAAVQSGERRVDSGDAQQSEEASVRR
jgi:hypothetical protein